MKLLWFMIMVGVFIIAIKLHWNVRKKLRNRFCNIFKKIFDKEFLLLIIRNIREDYDSSDVQLKFKYDIAVAIIESEVFNIQKQLESLIDLAEMVAKKAMGSSEQQDKIRNVISCLRQACAYNASSISNEKELIEARDAIAKNRTKIYQIFWKSVNKL